MDGFPGSLSNLTDDVIATYVDATLDCDEEAILRSVEQYTAGRVEEHRGAFAPSSGDFARNVRMWGQALAVLHKASGEREQLVIYPIGEEPPPPLVPLGPLKVDFGHGVIDMTKMSPAEKEAVILHSGLPPTEGERLGVMPRLRRLGDA